MAQIYFNTHGPLDRLPVIERIDNHAGPVLQHWFTVPGAPRRLGCWVEDNYTPHTQGHLVWQNQHRGIIMPPPGAYEATQPPVQPPDAPPLEIVYRLLPLLTRGRDFVDSTGARWLYIGIDGFSLLDRMIRRGEDVTQRLREAKAIGANLVRVFASGDINRNTFCDLRPGGYDYDAVLAFLDICAAEGLRCEITNADYQNICPSESAQRTHLHELFDRIGSHHPGLHLGECANEARNNGLEDGAVESYPGVLMSRGSSLSDGMCPLPAMQWAGSHGRRDERAKILDSLNVAHHQDGGWEPGYKVGNIPVVNNEPIGIAAQAVPGRRTNDPALCYEIGAVSAALNGGCVHGDPWHFGHDPQPIEQQCAEAMVAGLTGARRPFDSAPVAVPPPAPGPVVIRPRVAWFDTDGSDGDFSGETDGFSDLDLPSSYYAPVVNGSKVEPTKQILARCVNRGRRFLYWPDQSPQDTAVTPGCVASLVALRPSLPALDLIFLDELDGRFPGYLPAFDQTCRDELGTVPPRILNCTVPFWQHDPAASDVLALLRPGDLPCFEIYVDPKHQHDPQLRQIVRDTFHEQRAVIGPWPCAVVTQSYLQVRNGIAWTNLSALHDLLDESFALVDSDPHIRYVLHYTWSRNAAHSSAPDRGTRQLGAAFIAQHEQWYSTLNKETNP